MYLEGKKHIHFIGIGGSGMFPIAQILHAEGFTISGSDNNETDTLALVRKMGAKVTLGQRPENIEGADLIVYTAAIMVDNPELIAAKASGIPTIERSEMLGELTARYSHMIGVSGTHGKTTTSAMLTQILLDAGKDPSCVIGGKLPAIGGNGRAGSSEIMVCESCEFVDTFLKLYPDVAVILNIDADHLDYFKTLENIIRSFHQFAQKATKAVIYNGDDDNTKKALVGIEKPLISFGFEGHNDYYPENIRSLGGVDTAFTVMYQGKALTDVTIHIPGRHNILNTLAAVAAAIDAGVTPEECKKGIDAFFGAGRRFEVLAKIDGITIADDYAHHPAEIEATLKAAKALPFQRVIAVHQPFTYSRTAMLLSDFAKVLPIADEVVLSEIMGSREKNTYNIYAKDLAALIPGCKQFATFEEIADYVVSIAKEGDLIITLGCGDIYKAAKLMIKKLEEKRK